MPQAEPTAPTINFAGERVALGPFTAELFETDLRWINDFEIQRNMAHIPRPWVMEQTVAYHQRVAESDTYVLFVIYEQATWQPIGTTGLKDIDYHHRTAEFGIMLGERSARGKGYGSETARLILDYAFTALGLHNVFLEVLEFNTAGIRAYEKAGFREIGRRTACHFASGRWWDLVQMECLATEFTSPVLSTVFAPDIPR